VNIELKALMMKGREYFERGEFEQALRIFGKAIQVYPYETDPYLCAGNALERLGKIREAIRLYEKSLSFKSDSSDSLVSRGRAIINLAVKERGKPDEKSIESAIKDFDKAIKINPNDYWAYSEKAILLLRLKRFDEAWSIFEKAIERNLDEDPETFLRAGMCLGFLADKEKNIEPFQKANKFYRAIALMSMGFSDQLSRQQLEDYRKWQKYFKIALNSVVGKY